MRRSLVLFLFFLLIICTQKLRAGWSCSPAQSVPVVVAPGNQGNVRLAGDGKMGVYLVWQDRRAGPTDKLYMQHLDRTGSELWQSGGVAVSGTPGFQNNPQVAPDGSGGVVVVWQDIRNGTDYDIYVQRYSDNGIQNWTPGGVSVCVAPRDQYFPQVAGDGAGGFIVVWQDYRNGNYDVYAQRIDGSGKASWTSDGVSVCSDPSRQISPQLVGDGIGGAYVTWTDYRPGNGTSDIYCQHILAGGGMALNANGIAVCSARNTQWNPQIAADGSQGAIVCWQDRRAVTGNDQVYAQRIDNTGTLMWDADGIPLAPSSGIQYYPRVASDGAGGAVAVWQDNRTGMDYDIYAQHVSSTGHVLWTDTGQAVCTAQGQQYYPQLSVDGQTVLFVWQDLRSGSDYDIYGQRIDLGGIPHWPVNGTLICNSPGHQTDPQITGDGIHGGIIAWDDYRDGTGTTDIYAQRIGPNGALAGGCYRSFTQDSLGLTGVRLYINKKTPIRLPNAGNVRDTVFRRGGFPNGMTIGIQRTDSAKHYGWEVFLRSLNVRWALPETGIARPFDRFSYRKFVGAFRNLTRRVYNNSLVGELIALKLNIVASDLRITAPQFGDIIFNDPSTPANILNGKSLRQVVTCVDTLLTMWQHFSGINYRQIAVSIHNINMAFDGLIDTTSTRPLLIKSTRALYGVPFLIPSSDPPAEVPQFVPQPLEENFPTEYVLYQNYPNPFNPTTTIEFNLPQSAIVTVRVYNLLGQEIAKLLEHVPMEEGSQQVFFDASGLSSGVYFYRLLAEDANGAGKSFSAVKKMMLVK